MNASNDNTMTREVVPSYQISSFLGREAIGSDRSVSLHSDVTKVVLTCTLAYFVLDGVRLLDGIIPSRMDRMVYQ
jgi:hypothetical protein